MKHVTIALAALLVVVASQVHEATVSYSDIGSRITVLGRFGQPLGSYLVLKGHRIGTEMHDAMNVRGDFKAAEVNGVKLKEPRMMWIDDVAKYSNGTAVTVRGYESGQMIGVPAEVTQKEGGIGSQTPWHFETEFICVRSLKG